MSFLRTPHAIGLATLILAAATLAACVSPASPAPARPALVVLLVVDGLPQRQLLDYRDQLAPDGLRRFLERGAWFSQAHFGHASTTTGPGHAAMLTGAYPHRTGIIGNEWRDTATGELHYCTGDTGATYIGHATHRLSGTSPRKLRAESLGDVLRRVEPRSKVISISGKDRGAILPAGKSGTAYMYMGTTGQFASSTYYMNQHPGWVTAFNSAKPADAYLGRQWKPLLDDAQYARSLPDGQPWHAQGGRLPMTLGEGLDKPEPAFFGLLVRTHFGDALTLDFARAAIAGENLGRDEASDILVLSLSGLDYVNHAFGAESRLSHDHVLQVDRLLEAFFRDLDIRVGKDNYLAVLTSDHGFMPVPEHSLSLGRDAGRIGGRQLIGRVNAGLAQAFGQGQWVAFVSAQGVVYDKATLARSGVDREALDAATLKLLLAEEGVAVAYTRAELESGNRAGAPHFEAMRKSWHRELSGDIQFVLKPYWMFSTATTGTTHGSPHAYDTHVPLAFYGPAWVTPGRHDARVEVVDIAPTLAKLLGIAPPASSEGKSIWVVPR